TPFGGIAVLISFRKIGFVKALRDHMPIRWKSPNHIDPGCTFTAFRMPVLVGTRQFAHASLLRSDRALHALLDLDRFPTDGTIHNLFRALGMGEVQRFYEAMAERLRLSRTGDLASRCGRNRYLASPRLRSGAAFASWLGLRPDADISSGRVLSVQTRKVNNRAALALR
ncbi:MAG TPA: hypothetical protein VKV15_21315, partial [Bryobacteraceae bacterium]|nr:hypothetical protein [Bryobacteraceae bacterium]